MSKQALPQGWSWSTLGEVADYGKTIKVEPSEIKPEEWILELEDIEKGSSRLLQRAENSELRTKSTKNRFKKGDVLYGKLRPYLNKVLLADKEGVCSTEIIPLSAPEGIDGRYLFYSLRRPDFIEYVTTISHGLNMPRLGTKAGQDAIIPLAPTNEQESIADKLDLILAQVGACRERLDRVPVILKSFRQAVLSAGCSGRLTADWRVKNCLEEEGELPKGWTSTPLGDLLSLLTSGSRGWAQYYAKSGSLFIRAQNINSDFLDLSDIAYVCLPDKAEGLRTQVRKEDLLVTITGANVTKSARVSDALDNAYVSQHVALVRLKDIRQSPYVFMALISPAHGRAQLLEAAYGAGKPGLNLNNIREVNILLPPLSEQQEIVQRVEKFLAFADRLDARHATARKRVDQLTPSLLAKAFRGELVPQDPKDEPAEILLERIRAAKIGSAPSRRTAASRATRPVKEPVYQEPIAPLPLVAKPAPVTARNIPQAILAAMKPGSEYTRADILSSTGIKEPDWLWAVKQLRNERKLVQVGEKRGAKYHKPT